MPSAPPEPALARATAVGENAQQGVDRAVGEAQREQHPAQQRQVEAEMIAVELRQVDV
jgi:hypothetical protein